MKTQVSFGLLAANKIIFIAASIAALTASCSSDENSGPGSGSTYTLDETSVAEWAGRSGETVNTGSLDVSSSDLLFADGQLKSGTFIMPVATLENFNIEDPALKEMFLNHLKSEDFFNMALHPNLEFTITNVVDGQGLQDPRLPDANAVISGDLEMLGVTQQVHIPARIDANANTITIKGVYTIDRTAWGMDYATDPNDPEHFIEPDVDIVLKLKGTK